MRAPGLWFAFVLLVAAGPASAAGFHQADLRFSFPSDAHGSVRITADARGFAFGQAGSMDFQADRVEVVQEEVAVIRADGQILNYARGQEINRRSIGVFHDVEANWEADEVWGMSVWDAAWNVNAGNLTFLGVVPANQNPDELLWKDRPQPLVRPLGFSPETQVFTRLAGSGDSLVWTGDLRIELFGWEGLMNHRSGQERLESGQRAGSDGAAGASGSILRYLILDVTNASIQSNADSWQTLVGTGHLSSSIDGTLTLVDVAVDKFDGAIHVDVDGSWQVRGQTVLEVEPVDEKRARGTVRGDLERLAVGGNEILQGKQGLVVAVGAPLGALLVGVLLKGVGGLSLFTRLTPDQALEHERRRRLFDYIKARPGPNFREMVRATGIPAGTCRHHLNVLRRSDLIVEREHGASVRFFENHGRFEKDWETVAVLRDAELKRVHAWLRENPGVMQKDYLEHAESVWGWSRSTAQHRLKRLQDSGLLDVKQFGRSKHYEARDSVRKDDVPFHPLTWRG